MIRKSWSTGFPVQKLQVTNEFFFSVCFGGGWESGISPLGGELLLLKGKVFVFRRNSSLFALEKKMKEYNCEVTVLSVVLCCQKYC